MYKDLRIKSAKFIGKLGFDGFGIGGLLSCSVVAVSDETHIDLIYKESRYKVEQFYYNNHIISTVKGDNEIEWIVADKLIKTVT